MLLTPTQQKSKGFTLIELIIVIVILGILAVTAAPRFLSLSGDARGAVLQGLAGSLKSAASIYHSRALIEDGGLTNGFVSEGVLFDQGYPIGVNWPPADADDRPEILEAMELDLDPNDPEWTFNTQFSDSEGPAPNNVTRGLYITLSSVIAQGATVQQITATNCYVSYESFLQRAEPPAVKVIDSGCN